MEEITSTKSNSYENEQDTRTKPNPDKNKINNDLLSFLTKNMLTNVYNINNRNSIYPYSSPYYPNLNENEDYSNNNNNRYITPYVDQKVIDHMESYLYTHYKNLLFINKKNASLFQEISYNDKFFVIKSFTEEDIHKSMKYGVWSSSTRGNKILNNTFQEIKKYNKGNVYLFFSCNKSGRFCGVAKMISTVDDNKIFELWTQDNKWPGLFNVEWVFIKDVPMKVFKNVVFPMNTGDIRPVSYSRDCQEIPFNCAKIMMKIFANYENSNTIFEKFEFYDLRQEQYIKNKIKNNKNNKNNNDKNKEKDKDNNSANNNKNVNI